MCLFSHFCLRGKTVKQLWNLFIHYAGRKKIGKSKIDIDFQFLLLNWKLKGRMTHGPSRTLPDPSSGSATVPPSWPFIAGLGVGSCFSTRAMCVPSVGLEFVPFFPQNEKTILFFKCTDRWILHDYCLWVYLWLLLLSGKKNDGMYANIGYILICKNTTLTL